MSTVQIPICLASLLLLLACGSASAGRLVRIIDRDAADQLDLNLVASLVCGGPASGSEMQIGRLSTIGKLKELFDTTTGAQKLAECKRLHGRSLNELHELITINRKNVCSDESVSLIEQYHVRYISTNVEHQRQRALEEPSEAPEMLRLFFMHYAMEVSSTCQSHLINNLEWDLSEHFGHVPEFKVTPAGRLMDSEDPAMEVFNQALDKFAQMDQLQRFDDVLMFWDLVDDSVSLDRNYTERLAIGRPPHRDVRLRFKVREAPNMRRVQAKCSNKYRPIYSRLILPIVRLSNLGYLNTGDRFKFELEELRTSSLVKFWYQVTQLCETYLPMRLYESPDVDWEEVIMITEAEAETLKEPELVGGEQQIEYEPVTNSFEQVDLLASVETDEAQRLVAKVDSSLTAKNRNARRSLVYLFRNAKRQLTSKLRGVKLFFSKPGHNPADPVPALATAPDFHKEEIGQCLGVKFAQITEQDLMKMEGGSLRKSSLGQLQARAPIERSKGRKRKGDMDMIAEMRASQLAYSRTKTWTEIWDGWMGALSQLAPTRLQIALVGGFIIFMLFILLLVVPLGIAGSG